jgi:hypothetical protein
MKFIVLNVWQGVLEDPLLSFLKSKQRVDVFCLQEVLNGGETELEKFWSRTEGKCWNLLPLIQAALPAMTC